MKTKMPVSCQTGNREISNGMAVNKGFGAGREDRKLFNCVSRDSFCVA
jgi:hypothetical protein